MLIKLHKFLFLCFFILSIFLLSCKTTFATVFFQDDFNNVNNDTWDYILNGGKISFQDGIMTLDSNNASGFPVVKSKFGPVFSDSVDSVFEIKFKYNSDGSMGDGISIGFTGTTNYPFYEFSLWRDRGSSFFYNNFASSDYGWCNPSVYDAATRVYTSGINIDQNWHILRIEKTSSTYKVFIDKDKYASPIFVTYDGNCNPTTIFLGNPLTGGGNDWNSLSIDYISVFSLNDNTLPSPTPTAEPTATPIPTATPTPEPTATPIPTATPTPKRKIIILPGMGASWNSEAVVYGKETDDWQMTPMITNYNGLIKSLENNGLKNGVDFWVWNYDWRKPLSTIETKFGSFINDKVKSGEKVELIGHSLGGLVARIWGQDNAGDARLDKIITLGSPNQGSLTAYEAWNGAMTNNVVVNILIQLERKNADTTLNTVRTYIPVIKDLLPTFNFAKKNNKEIGVADLKTKNDFLSAKNSTVKNVFGNLSPVIGVGESTPRWFVLGETGWLNKILGYWPDGEIDKTSFDNGDGTVLINSGKFEDLNFDSVVSNHGQIVDKSLPIIMDKLGLDKNKVAPGETISLNDKLVFFMGSPADLAVKCGNANYPTDEMGFVVAEAKDKCVVTVLGKQSGVYHLVWGKGVWNYKEKNILVGQTDTLVVDSNGQIIPKDSQDFLWSLVKNDLDLLKIKINIDKQKPDQVEDKVAEFRKKTGETKITDRILDNLILLMSLTPNKCGRNQANVDYNRSKLVVEMSENWVKYRPWWWQNNDKAEALVILKMEDYLGKMKTAIDQNNCSLTEAYAAVVGDLAKEVW